MATCGESAYQMVENATGRDLTFAKLVLAQINSIDAEANAANVTIADECMQGVDTSAVPFFYHCQFSDGSLEDLAFGYSAFAPGEWVYVLHIPAGGEDAAEIYVLGHSDIRGTMLCNLPIAVGLQTVGEDVVLWEKYLEQCVPPPAVFLPSAPIHLMNFRYVHEGVVASIIVCQTAENYWHVIVDRRGADVVRYDYYPAFDGLIVSAALSEDLNHLYVVESRQPEDEKIGTYHHYSFADGAWSEVATGTIPKPTAIKSSRAYYVDRSGEVHGYWATESTVRTEEDDEGVFCIGASGHQIDRSYRDYTNFWGGSWSILTQEYTAGGNRTDGAVIHNNDIALIKETPADSTRLEYLWSFSFTSVYTPIDELDATYRWNYTRDQENVTDQPLHFTAKVGVDSLSSTKDYGVTYTFSAHQDVEDHQYRVSPEIRMRRRTVDVTFSDYTHHDGTISMVVTPGGWASVDDSATVVTANMTPYHYEIEVGAGDSYTPPACSDMSYFISSTSSESRYSRDIIYPVALGSFYSIERSFTSYDQVSETEYIGAMVKFTAEGDPEWRVYKDRELATDEVEACIGIPIENLHAIYFRA